jgi:cyclopropane-fatty-acyl-phospholipid synthase
MTIAGTIQERLPASARDAVVSSAIELAERGWLPDTTLRAGIRHFVRERLDEQQANGTSTAVLAARLRAMPIAVGTDLANEQHYEMPVELFSRMLGPWLKYSCASWPAGISGLAAAEEAMLELTRKRAGVEDGMRVLDLGCGWGSFALWLASRQPLTRITCASNSTRQKRFIEERAARLGLSNVRVVTADINQLELDERFDRVVSIEMFEHVRNYDRLLARVRHWLAPGGRLFVHIFCHRDHAYLYESQGAGDWMSREFFSGGTMPSFDLLEHFPDELVVEAKWWIDGTHYQRTAEAWLDNLDANAAALASVLDNAGAPGGGRRSLQRWRLFVLACSEMFGHDEGRQWGVGHFLFAPAKT